MNSGDSIPKPRIPMSFLIPAKNISKYFETLKSQIEENLTDNDEVILIDDYSEDDTSFQLGKWAKSKTNICVIKNQGEKGLISALNLGLSLSSNKWVARFDADDMYSQNRIYTQSKYVSENTVAIFSDYEFISESGKKLGKVPSAIYPIQTSLSLVKANRTAHPSVILNRDAAIEVGGYRRQDYLAEDLSLWLRMSRLGQLRTVPEVLLNYRLNSGSLTVKSQALSRKMRDSVLSEIRINPVDTQAAFQNLDFLLEMYSEDKAGSFRKFLFLRDLKSSFSIFDGSVRRDTSRVLNEHLRISSLYAAPLLIQGGFNKILRDVYRKGLLSPRA